MQISTGFSSWQRYCMASSSGHQPNFAALNRGCHLCLAGRPSRWALVHILVRLSVLFASTKKESYINLTKLLPMYILLSSGNLSTMSYQQVSRFDALGLTWCSQSDHKTVTKQWPGPDAVFVEACNQAGSENVIVHCSSGHSG